MTDEAFEEIVKQTITELPEEFKTQLDNVDIVIGAWPMDDHEDADILGVYHGVPKPERDSTFTFPDKIILYKEAILAISASPEEAKKHIRDTVLHELGHHFGLEDDQMPE